MAPDYAALHPGYAGSMSTLEMAGSGREVAGGARKEKAA